MSSHSITAENLLQNLPQVLQNAPNTAALADSVADVLAKRPEEIKTLSIYAQIDALPEKLLDILAHDFKVDWYNYDYPIETKRELLKSCWSIHRRLGTKWAVENVINAYFDDGQIKEWFQYGGNPGCFQVYSSNPMLNEGRLTEFLNLLNKVKRASSKLDGIVITLTGQMDLHVGVALHEIGTEQYGIGVAAPV